ncbi:hypothetical protein FC81_GL000327 [Liquorilactobacillus capillatus DSM 19910]|uniref:Membrane ancor connecting MutS2 with cell-division Z-ring n=2 Tax=Liquorilactobacillus capillatus TaxID=480931 RepID=A0A0R1MB57_9LACO|nr:hypothetical protein FC81_GL000327 [Liquorilactobacillus capillatus DSM 19910]
MNLIGIIVLFVVANKYADTVSLWVEKGIGFFTRGNTDTAVFTSSTFFYHGIAYWLIIIIGGVILGTFVRKLNLITRLPVISQLNAIAGGILSLVIAYLLVFASLLILVGWPTENVRHSVKQSPLAMFILRETPVISENLYQNYLQQPNE